MAVHLDEARIAEIVERVMARLGGVHATGHATATPPAGVSAGSHITGPGPGASRIPRGTRGVYQDPDAATQAARRGFEQTERAPIALRAQMIAAMRAVTEKHLRELAQYAVEETGLGRADDKIGKNRLVMEKMPGCEIFRPVAYT